MKSLEVPLRITRFMLLGRFCNNLNEKSQIFQVLLWFQQINPLSPDGVHTYDRLVVLNNQNMNLTLTLKN